MNPTGTAVRDELELEFKLRARSAIAADAVDAALTAAGVEVERAGTTAQVDLYLDDRRRSLLRQGIGLRLRRLPDGAVLCVKDRGKRHGSLHARREIELPWPTEAPPTCAVEMPERIRDAVEPFVLDRPLETMVLLEVQRELRHLLHDGAYIGELACDRATAHSQGRSASFFEIELEVLADLPACDQLAQHLLAALPVEAATGDKLAHSLRLLELAPPEAAPCGPQPTGGSSLGRSGAAGATLGDLLARRLSTQVGHLLAAEAAVRLDGGAEDIHELRVALRRLRVLLRAFRSAWPPAQSEPVGRALGSLARGLGDLREHDVLLARLPQALSHVPEGLRSAGPALVELLHSARHSLLQRAHAALRSAAHCAELAQLQDLAQPAAMLAEVATLPAAAAAAQLRAAARAVRRDLRTLSADSELVAIHRVRLDLKRLRILAEECAEVCPTRGRVRRRLAKALRRLGELCDHDAAETQCLGLLEAPPGDGLSPRLAALLGAIATWHRIEVPAARRAAVRACRRLDRRWFWLGFRPSAP